MHFLKIPSTWFILLGQPHQAMKLTNLPWQVTLHETYGLAEFVANYY